MIMVLLRSFGWRPLTLIRWKKISLGGALDPAVQHEDASLVMAMANGDQSALHPLYERYSGWMLAIAMKILRNRREAEDLLHDVFLEAWRKAGDYDPSRGTVRTWLTLRMRSRSLDRVRSARLSRSVSLDVGFPEWRSLRSDDDPALHHERDLVRKAVMELSDETREVILLAYFEGLSATAVAERLGIPVGTVKSRVAAAKLKLRGILGETVGEGT